MSGLSLETCTSNLKAACSFNCFGALTGPLRTDTHSHTHTQTHVERKQYPPFTPFTWQSGDNNILIITIQRTKN